MSGHSRGHAASSDSAASSAATFTPSSRRLPPAMRAPGTTSRSACFRAGSEPCRMRNRSTSARAAGLSEVRLARFRMAVSSSGDHPACMRCSTNGVSCFLRSRSSRRPIHTAAAAGAHSMTWSTAHVLNVPSLSVPDGGQPTMAGAHRSHVAASNFRRSSAVPASKRIARYPAVAGAWRMSLPNHRPGTGSPY